MRRGWACPATNHLGRVGAGQLDVREAGYGPQAFAVAGSGSVVLVGDLARGCHQQCEQGPGCPSVGADGLVAAVSVGVWQRTCIDACRSTHV